jgi:hypothetical protein
MAEIPIPRPGLLHITAIVMTIAAAIGSLGWMLYTGLVISIGSLISYGGILIPAGTKPAFIFLVVPLISWLLIAMITLPAISRSGKSKV